MSDLPALRISNLRKQYLSNAAVDDVSFDIADGELVARVGHNGSGKSTLLRIAAGLLESSSGTISVHGYAPESLEARGSVSFIPDEPVLYDDLSVWEHLEYTARLHDAEEWQARAEDLLARLRLSDRRNDLPATFSRGLRQKTSIAVGLIRPFDVLLVDEPFVGLDPSGRAAFLELLLAMRADGAAVVVATHQIEVVQQLERCVVMRDGAVIHDGKPMESLLRDVLG
jgi:ABC-type multidrug transport system ATPase subunit